MSTFEAIQLMIAFSSLYP
ncbi:putative holin-like toxin [Enterococcus durans]